jgi:penicillin-binding protein 1C
VRTTLDGALQRMAAESLRRHLLAVRGEHVQDGAVLVVDNGSGEVLAMSAAAAISAAPGTSTASARGGRRARR